jgi:very-short-patch-repair endonuclease
VGARMQNQSTPNAQVHARELRRAMTDSERKLWSALRGEQLGVKFRRQHPLGNYVADFACLDPKLIVELDGSQHADQHEYDTKRDEFFRAGGFTVLRFKTDEPFRNREGVLTVIFDKVKLLAGGAPIPAFPQRGKEKDNRGIAS